MSLYDNLLNSKLPAIKQKSKGFSTEHPLVQEAKSLTSNVRISLIKNRIKMNTKDIENADETEEVEEIATTAKTPSKTVAKSKMIKDPKKGKKTQKRAK